jgi:hypothetical protein
MKWFKFAAVSGILLPKGVKNQNVKNFMRIISILKNYYCRGSVRNITSTGSTVCICISYCISKVHRFKARTLLYILFIINPR